MTTLSEALASGIPCYEFGSAELQALHDEARDPPEHIATRGEDWHYYNGGWYAGRTYPIFRQTYGWCRHGFTYLVDHGGFHTINVIERGQVVPRSEFIA